ncbi:MAG: SDR family oxidoreductase [Bacteroidales bacterium]|nr:SDR family oxidoreductase [Bacteroidales bacterium]
MKIGITGATGQLGRIVVEELKEKTSANDLVALVRSPQKANDLDIEVREFDYNNPNHEALAGIDKLLLISGNEIGKRIEQHTRVIDAAKKAGVRMLVYTSLLRTDSSSLVLAGEHHKTEEAIVSSGIPYVFLRDGWYTENYTASLPHVVAMGILYGSSGNGKISSASRKDYAEAAAIVLTSAGHEGQVYELAGDESFTMSDLAAEISRQVGKAIDYVNLPEDEYAQLLVKAGLPAGAAQFYAGTHTATTLGDLFDDSRQLSKLIGRPTTSLEKVISEALEQAK